MKLCKTCKKEKTGSHASYCKSCNSSRVVEWKRKNREKYNEYSKNLARKKSLEDYKEYRESRNKSNRLWVEKNKEKVKNYKDNWRKKNPEKFREYDRKRRAEKLKNGFEKYTEQQVISLYGIKCHICVKPIDMSANRAVGSIGWENSLHVDHLVPISKGGADTLANVRPSHAMCNLKKSNSVLQ